ncbi:MAG: hypothetical protein ACKPKO_15490, partial [Candidatus Fonsibacter sp.]
RLVIIARLWILCCQERRVDFDARILNSVVKYIVGPMQRRSQTVMLVDIALFCQRYQASNGEVV